jgi:uncharacterized protein
LKASGKSGTPTRETWPGFFDAPFTFLGHPGPVEVPRSPYNGGNHEDALRQGMAVMSEGEIHRNADDQEEPLPVTAEPLLYAQIVPVELPPPRPPHPGFWWAVLWCLGFLLITQVFPALIGSAIMIVMLMLSSNQGPLPDLQAITNTDAYALAMMVSMLLSQIMAVFVSWLVIRLIVGKEWPRILALRRPSLAHLLLALIGLPGLIIIGMGVDALAKDLPSYLNIEKAMALFGKWPWPLGVLIIGVGPGIGEELWCRGFLGRGLVGRYGFLAGVLLTSLLFGVIHLEPRQVVAAFVMGIFLHGSYLASRSLLVPMLLHMGNNSLAILAMHIPSLKALDNPEQIPLPIYGAGVLLTAAVVWAFFQSRARLRDFRQSRQDTSFVPVYPGFQVQVQEAGPLLGLTDDPGETAFPWRPAFAGVEYPPSGTATSVSHPWPDWKTWILVAAGLLLFVGSVFWAFWRPG